MEFPCGEPFDYRDPGLARRPMRLFRGIPQRPGRCNELAFAATAPLRFVTAPLIAAAAAGVGIDSRAEHIAKHRTTKNAHGVCDFMAYLPKSRVRTRSTCSYTIRLLTSGCQEKSEKKFSGNPSLVRSVKLVLFRRLIYSQNLIRFCILQPLYDPAWPSDF
jgi:hypothetical protein